MGEWALLLGEIGGSGWPSEATGGSVSRSQGLGGGGCSRWGWRGRTGSPVRSGDGYGISLSARSRKPADGLAPATSWTVGVVAPSACAGPMPLNTSSGSGTPACAGDGSELSRGAVEAFDSYRGVCGTLPYPSMP
jgi:hypothetical protein